MLDTSSDVDMRDDQENYLSLRSEGGDALVEEVGDVLEKSVNVFKQNLMAGKQWWSVLVSESVDKEGQIWVEGWRCWEEDGVLVSRACSGSLLREVTHDGKSVWRSRSGRVVTYEESEAEALGVDCNGVIVAQKALVGWEN